MFKWWIHEYELIISGSAKPMMLNQLWLIIIIQPTFFYNFFFFKITSFNHKNSHTKYIHGHSIRHDNLIYTIIIIKQNQFILILNILSWITGCACLPLTGQKKMCLICINLHWFFAMPKKKNDMKRPKLIIATSTL